MMELRLFGLLSIDKIKTKTVRGTKKIFSCVDLFFFDDVIKINGMKFFGEREKIGKEKKN